MVHRAKSKGRRSRVEWFKIKGPATAVSISFRGPRLSRLEPDGEANSVIKIEGALDRPVLKRESAFMYVFCGSQVGILVLTCKCKALAPADRRAFLLLVIKIVNLDL